VHEKGLASLKEDVQVTCMIMPCACTFNFCVMDKKQKAKKIVHELTLSTINITLRSFGCSS